jgi:hypothetical protein
LVVAVCSFSSLKMLMFQLGESAVGKVLVKRISRQNSASLSFGIRTGEWDVEAVRLKTNLVDGLDGLIVKINLLEVLVDARESDRLGDDGVAANLSPGKENMGGSDSLALGSGQALGSGLDVGVGDEKRSADGVVAKGGVGSDDDVLLVAVLHQLGVEETRVALDLVGRGGDTGGVDDGVELF